MNNGAKRCGGPAYWPDDACMLAFDTATSAMTAAVLRGGRPVRESFFRAERNHSIRLVPALRDLLADAGVDVRDLAAVAVGVGPGSYTGVRIGVTVAKTMAWSLGLPAVAVSTLSALAWRGRRLALGAGGPDAGRLWVVPVLDARRGRVYTGLYASEGDGGDLHDPARWTAVRPDGVRPVAEWLDEVKALADSAASSRAIVRVVFVGEVAPIEQAVAERFGSRPDESPKHRESGPTAEAAVRADVLAADVSAVDVGELAWAKARRGQIASAHDLVPNYTQLSEAEKKWLAARGGAADGSAVAENADV